MATFQLLAMPMPSWMGGSTAALLATALILSGCASGSGTPTTTAAGAGIGAATGALIGGIVGGGEGAAIGAGAGAVAGGAAGYGYSESLRRADERAVGGKIYYDQNGRPFVIKNGRRYYVQYN